LGTIKPIYTVSEQLMDEVDPTLLDLVKTTVNSFTKWDLARFYSENPHVIVTAETVARRLKCNNLAAIRLALEELADGGLIQKFVYDETTSYYALAADERTKDLVNSFIVACEDDDFRLKTVYHITQEMFRI